MFVGMFCWFFKIVSSCICLYQSQEDHMMVMLMKYVVVIMIFLTLYQKVLTLLKLLCSVRKVTNNLVP